MARSIYLEEQRMPNLDNVPDVPEEHVYERSMSDEFNQNTTNLDLNMATDNELGRENGLENGMESVMEASGIAQADLLNFGDSMTQSSVFLVS